MRTHYCFFLTLFLVLGYSCKNENRSNSYNPNDPYGDGNTVYEENSTAIRYGDGEENYYGSGNANAYNTGNGQQGNYGEYQNGNDYGNPNGQQGQYEQQGQYGQQGQYQQQGQYEQQGQYGQQNQYEQQGGIQTVPLTDPKTRMLISTFTYPAQWKVLNKVFYAGDVPSPEVQTFIKGPNGVNFFNQPTKTHISIEDPSMQQLFAQVGAQSGAVPRPFTSIQQLIQQEIGPKMQKEGFRFESIRELSDMRNHLIQSFQRNGGNSRDAQIQVVGAIWSNGQNKKAMTIVKYLAIPGSFSLGGNYVTWVYGVGYLFADAPAFETTVAALKNATLTEQVNPQWEQHQLRQRRASVERSAQVSRSLYQNQSAAFAAHQQKMAANSAAQTQNHNNFMANLRGTDGSGGVGSAKDHNRFINFMRGEETVINPNTGYQRQVESGYDKTYFDQWGQPVQTNDPWYDGTNDDLTPAQTTDDYN